jgi:ribosomal protein S17
MSASADVSTEGFVIKGIQVRAVNSVDQGNVTRVSLGSTDARQNKNDISDLVNHATLKSTAGSAISPPVLTSSDADNIICAGETVTFTVTSTSPFIEFFVDGVSVQLSNSKTYTTTGLMNGQTVSARGTTNVSTTCPTGFSNSITTTVYATPILTSNDADNTICAGQEVIFTAAPSGLSTYNFYVAGVLVQSSSSHSYATTSLANGQKVRVEITNNTCTASSLDITTTVNTLPGVTLASSDGDNSICAGETLTFTATASIAVSAYEFFVDGLSKQSSTSHTYTTSTLSNGQTVTVKVTTASGCTATSSGITTTVNTTPIVSLLSSDADNIICAGEDVTFFATPLGLSMYEFFVNGVSKQSGTSNKYTTNSLSNGQTVTVKVTTASGCTATSTGITTTVNDSPSVTLTNTAVSNSICSGETVTFTANTSIPVSTYEFFVNGVSKQNGTANTYSTFALINGQTVTVKAVTAKGCTAISSGTTITVNPIPFVVLTSSDADNKVCAGETVTFTATAPTATTYEFYLQGVLVQSGISNVYTTALTDGQKVRVQVKDAANCLSVSNEITTTVNALPGVTLASSDGDNSICAGETLTFTANTSTAVSGYEFFVDGISKQSGASNTYTTNSLSNGQTVTVKVTTASGCTATSSGITTTVNPIPFVTLTSNAAANTSCSGDAVTFTASTNIAVSTYEFFINGVSKQSGVANTFTTTVLTDGDEVRVEVSALGACKASSNSIKTFVNVLTVVLTSSDADNKICAGETVTFTATAPTATTYEFYLQGVLVQNSATNLYTTTSLTSGQTVTVKAITASGCSATSLAGITTTVNALPGVTLTSSNTDNTICPGETLTFTATADIAVSGYEFLVDGISKQSGTSNTYTTSTLSNRQTVTVKVTTASACTALSETILIEVEPLIVTLVSSDPNNSICAGETVIFTANTSTAVSGYEFFVDGVSKQSGTSNTYTTNNLSNGQTVTVKVNTAGGCTATSGGITTIVNIVPAVTLTSSDADNKICAGETVTFTATAPTATTYEFYLQGVLVQNSATNLYTTTSLTSGQTVTVKAITASGCSATSLTGITTIVDALPGVTLASSDPNNSICAGETVTFTASSATATSYEFFVDGVSKQSGTSNTYITNSLSNGQTVTVKVTTASGCTATSTGITTTVNPLPFVTLTSNDDDNTICPGETLTFTASSATATSYEFLVDGVSKQSGVANTYTTNSLSNGETVTVRTSSVSNCTITSNSIKTFVNVLTVVLTSSDADNKICAGETVTFTATAPTATTYEFYLQGVLVQNSATNLYTTTSLTSGQTVTVKAITASGCSATSLTGITTLVNPNPTVTLTSSDADHIICAGQQITFTASSATATSYEFLVDGISKQSGTSNTYITNSLSNGQTVTVSAKTDAECAVLSNGIITVVNEIPIITLISNDNDNTICPGEMITFVANSPTATSFEFFVDGISKQTGSTNIYNTSALTNGQTVTVKATASSGCSATSSGITITVDKLSVTLTSNDDDNTICPGETLTFTASSATATSYEFLVDGVSKQSGTSNTYITNSLSNGQTVTVKVIAGICSLTSTGITTAVGALTVALTSSDIDNRICVAETLTFTASSATATSYEFFVDGISKQSSASSTYYQ